MTAAEFFEPMVDAIRLEELSQEAYHEGKKLHTLHVGVVRGHRYWVFDPARTAHAYSFRGFPFHG